MSEPQDLVWPEGLCKSKKLIHLIGSRTRDLLACSRMRSNCVNLLSGNINALLTALSYACIFAIQYTAHNPPPNNFISKTEILCGIYCTLHILNKQEFSDRLALI
jgi:hypothetical protein